MIDFTKLNITVFGDSVPAGIVFEKDKLQKLPMSCVDIVAKRLHIKNMSNISKYGQTWSRLLQKGVVDDYIQHLDTNTNNVAVFFMGGNDSDYEWAEVVKSPLTYHPEKTPAEKFKTLLNDTVQRFQQNNVKVIFCDLTPVMSERYVDTVISKLVDKSRVMEFLHNDIENVAKHQELYSSFITEIATTNHCELIHVRQGFMNTRRYDKLMCEDGIHPNKAGHQRIAKIVIKQIKKYIKNHKKRDKNSNDMLVLQKQTI